MPGEPVTEGVLNVGLAARRQTESPADEGHRDLAPLESRMPFGRMLLGRRANPQLGEGREGVVGRRSARSLQPMESKPQIAHARPWVPLGDLEDDASTRVGLQGMDERGRCPGRFRGRDRI